MFEDGLVIRCGHCHGPIPDTQVWIRESSVVAQCTACGQSSEIESDDARIIVLPVDAQPPPGGTKPSAHA
jgi:hypothetical protein